MAQAPQVGSIAVRIEYFAVLREHVGRAREELRTTAGTVGELYAELDARYAFPALGQGEGRRERRIP
jgi:molybdopterin converting factor small subunit